MSTQKFGTNFTIELPRTGAYLASLSKWGALPEVVKVKEAVRLLMALCPENESALPQVVNDAIRDDEISLWVFVDGKWVNEFNGPADASTQSVFYEFGINPNDFLVLLEKRGVHLPDELKLLRKVVEPVLKEKNGTSKRWTDTELKKLKDFRADHTEEQTALHFGVSGAYVRKKLAEFKLTCMPKPAHPFDGLGRRNS